jgi:hypothetical protein
MILKETKKEAARNNNQILFPATAQIHIVCRGLTQEIHSPVRVKYSCGLDGIYEFRFSPAAIQFSLVVNTTTRRTSQYGQIPFTAV